MGWNGNGGNGLCLQALLQLFSKLRFFNKGYLSEAWDVGFMNGGIKKEGEVEKNKEKAVVVEMFQMPVHYPRYSKARYEAMEEWQLDNLFREYGMSVTGGLHHKRSFAIGAFLWPDQI